jgi:isochorismate synthase EntC
MEVWFPEQESYLISVTPNSFCRHYSESYIYNKKSEFNGYSESIPPMPEWWVHQVNNIKNEIDKGTYQKHVLYHDIHFTGDNPSHFIKNSEGHGRFLVKLDDNRLLYGNSPECVINKVNDTVSIEVLGGTGSNLTDEYGDIYSKYKEEHQIIVEDLLQRNPKLEWSKKFQIKDIGYTKHIRSVLKYNTDESLEDIVYKVYPNYAIKSDGINDWWGTLIGYHNHTINQTKLFLSIRCGIFDIETKTHTVRSGVGITKDSDPQTEWLEIHTKLGWLKPHSQKS